MLTRRAFARGLALTVAGLLVPAPLVAAAEEPTRRLWALDGGMLGARAAPPLMLTEADRALLAALAEVGETFQAEALSQAVAFADAAGRVLLQIQDATRAYADFRAPDAEAIDRFSLSIKELVISGEYVSSPGARQSYTRTYRRRAA